jgi:hypothetical protein
METYWYCKKNSIIENYLNPDVNPARHPAFKNSVQGGENGKVEVGVVFS